MHLTNERLNGRQQIESDATVIKLSNAEKNEFMKQVIVELEEIISLRFRVFTHKETSFFFVNFVFFFSQTLNEMQTTGHIG